MKNARPMPPDKHTQMTTGAALHSDRCDASVITTTPVPRSDAAPTCVARIGRRPRRERRSLCWRWTRNLARRSEHALGPGFKRIGGGRCVASAREQVEKLPFRNLFSPAQSPANGRFWNLQHHRELVRGQLVPVVRLDGELEIERVRIPYDDGDLLNFSRP